MKKKNLLKVMALSLTFAMLCVGCGIKPVEEVIESNMEVISSEISTIDKDDKDSTTDVTTEVDTTETTEQNTGDAKATAKPSATSNPSATTKPSTSKATAAPTAKPSSTTQSNNSSSSSSNSSSNSSSSSNSNSSSNSSSAVTPTAAPTAAPTQKPTISDDVANGDSIGSAGIGGDCSHEFVDLGQYYEAPGCNRPGSGQAQCKKCGLKTNVPIPATGKHTYVKAAEYYEATCSESKEIHYSCSGCGDFYIDYIYNSTNHTYGYNEYGNCYGCGAHITDVTPATPTEAPAVTPDTTTSESTTPDTSASESTGDTGTTGDAGTTTE